MVNFYKKLLISIFTVLLSYLSFAQNGEIHGKISDAGNNEPVPFANIVVVGTQKGSASDIEGNFTIKDIKPGFVNLKVSFVGYKTKVSPDILVSNNNIPYIEINLEPSSEVLSEVVISVDPFEKKPEAPISMQSIGVKEIENEKIRIC